MHLKVESPGGGASRVAIEPLPFVIGRQPGCGLIIRDSRVSRRHAQLFEEGGNWWVEDLGSRTGTRVNGRAITRAELSRGDVIDFGVEDGDRLVFDPPPEASPTEALERLRALAELTRALHGALATPDVLAALVDAAMAVTGATRGALLLREKGALEVPVQRGAGPALPLGEIETALRHRRGLLAVELLHAVCVPLLPVRGGGTQPQETTVLGGDETAGALWLEQANGLSATNREILQALALEASTILENARLLEQERSRRHLEDELALARSIQQGLLPARLPDSGWLRAAGSSRPSRQVGGDYFDLRLLSDSCAFVAADIAGKGVGSALLAAFLQGVFQAAAHAGSEEDRLIGTVNDFLYERTGGEKSAAVFYGILQRDGTLEYLNTGFCRPFVLGGGAMRELESTGVPLGLLPAPMVEVARAKLSPGETLLLYSDGVADAASPEGERFGLDRLLVAAQSGATCRERHDAILAALDAFSRGADPPDDQTLLLLDVS